MLLFKAEHVPMILNGTKTQTRRLWARPRVKVGSLQKCYSGGLPMSPCPECMRRYYHQAEYTSVCPECHGIGHLQPFAIVRILRVWQETVESISDTGARAEGYEDARQYLAAFEEINARNPKWGGREGYEDEHLVWAVEFELVGAD